MRYRYYSFHRPVSVETYPRPAGNKVMAIRNFDDVEYVPEIGRTAFGYLEYSEKLREEDAEEYELMYGGQV